MVPKVKRALSSLLAVLMLLTLLPMSAFAVNDDLKGTLGITENIAVTNISDENAEMLANAAKNRYWGVHIDFDTSEIAFGRIHSACHIAPTENPTSEYVEISMNTPTQDSTSEDSSSTTGWAVLALVDGKLVTYPTEAASDNKLKFTVRLGENGTDLALACLTDASALSSFSSAVGDWGTLTLTEGDINLVDSLGYVRSYMLTLDMSDEVVQVLTAEQFFFSFDLTFYLNSVGLKIDAESISFEENSLFQLDPEKTEKVSDGCYMFTAKVNLDAWKAGNVTEVVGISYAAPSAEPLLFEGEVQVSLPPPNPWAGMIACVPLPLTIVEPPEDKETYHKITVTQADEGGMIMPRGFEGEVWVKKGESMEFTITPDEGYLIADVVVDGTSQGAVTEYTFTNVDNDNHTISATFTKDEITIKPVELYKYITSDHQHTGNEVIAGCFPEPRYDGIPEKAEIKVAGKVWNPKDHPGEPKYPFIVNYYESADATTPIIDDHAPGTYVAQIEILPELGAQLNQITINGKFINPETNKLHILAVSNVEEIENIDNITSEVQETPPTQPVENAVVVMPTGVQYTVKGTELSPNGGAEIRLLHDELLQEDDSSDPYAEMMWNRILKDYSGLGNSTYAMKYLDFIDANDSNIIVTPVLAENQTYDVYLPYPDGTAQNYKDYRFRVFEFEDLDRTYSAEKDYGDGVENAIKTSDIHELTVTPEANGIKVTVECNGRLGAMALAWEKTSSGGGTGGTTTYTIKAEAGAGGTITPNGSVRVSSGSDKTFTITPNDGYKISDVLVDGKSVGAVSKYTFEKVKAGHTIQAVFEQKIPVADPDDTGVSDWLNTKDHTVYLNGYPNGTFGPEKNMTRAEAAQMFYNLLLDQNVPVTVSFTDVPADAWYAKAVNALASLKMVNGVGDDRFDPNRSITRAEFTAMAMRFADLDTDGKNIFSDVKTGDWFYDLVVGSIQYGWITGYEDGTFRPNNTITRVEVTTITNRMLGRAADVNYADRHEAELRKFPDVVKGHWAYYQVVEATNAHEYGKTNGTETWTDLTN